MHVEYVNMDSNTLNTLLEKILTLLERFSLFITTWYGATAMEQVKTLEKASKELIEDIDLKNNIKEQIKGMTRDEKVKIAVSDV